jgi:4-aminobutyrate aminotransferase
MDALTANSISTFGGNPVSTAGAIATLDYILSHDLQANAAKLGTRLIAALRALAEKYPVIGDVRGKGLMIGVELVNPDGTPRPEAAAHVLNRARENGLLIGKGGLHGNVLRLAPPLTLTEDEADEALEKLTGAIASANAES